MTKREILEHITTNGGEATQYLSDVANDFKAITGSPFEYEAFVQYVEQVAQDGLRNGMLGLSYDIESFLYSLNEYS